MAAGAVEDALARLLRSDPVRGSRRTADFLAFTVGEVLAGRGDQLKERTVAAGALGRGARFDPRVDPSVRVQARRVRAALERYYAGPGAADPVRIELPRGGYAPVFRPHDPSVRTANGHGPVAPTRVAVVSLANLTPGGELDHLAPGLSETLVAALTLLPGWRVIGPIPAGPAGGPDPEDLRDRHGVRFVVAGSARARGAAVRVCLRIVDTAHGETTWSMIRDGRLDGESPFAIEDGIAAEVAAALAAEPRPPGVRRAPTRVIGPTPGVPSSAAMRPPDALEAMRVTGHLPPRGHRGRARLGRWSVGADDARIAEDLQRRWSPQAEGHPLPPGEYSVLLIDGEFSMSDAPFVLRNYVDFLAAAEGDVLLTGLGLGCLVRGLLTRPAVRSVTVLELHADVLELIGPHHRHPDVELVHADALEWRPPPGRRFDVAMLDITDDRDLVERLVAHHEPHVHALWPNPAEIPDEPGGPDLEHLTTRARAAAAG